MDLLFRRIALLTGCLLGLSVSASGGDSSDPLAGEFFEKKVRPLLIENCFACHSTNKKQKANLLLDSRAGLLKGGDSGPAIVPGQPEQSRLVKAIRYNDVELRMPPRSRLSDEQIADLTTWVAHGASWPASATISASVGKIQSNQHAKLWSLQPPKPAPIPAVRRGDWARTPVDSFILARLEAVGLQPAAPAERRTLLRRVTYDLIGLPPTPAEITAFLADQSPDAYAKVVERLLASPHYGERWGRHWLDLVRYAETAGHEFDFDMPEAYVYRDYVIRAFNADVPFDQFVKEQIAGDLLPQPRRHPTEGFNESIIGTGFFFFGECKHSPVDVRGDEADRIDNQIDVFGKTFCGLTVACARCHDHKFDPITTNDYYALAGYVRSSRYQRAFIDAPDSTRAIIQRLAALRDQIRPLAVAATARRLETLIDDNGADLAHMDPVLAPFRMLSSGPESASLATMVGRRLFVQELGKQATRAAALRAKTTRFDDFARSGYENWFVSGEAFGDGPNLTLDFVLSPESGLIRAVVPSGVVHSGRISARLQGVLRSQTFTIDKPKILYRVSGRGCRINLVIDGLQQIRDPIYGGLTFRIDHDRPQWHVQDVAMWRGHRAYIEIIDDDPAGAVAIEEILLADDATPPEAPNSLVVRLIEGAAHASPEALMQKYRRLLQEIIEQWRTGQLETVPDAADRTALLNQLLLNLSPHGGDDKLARDPSRLAALAGGYQRLEAALKPSRRAMALEDGTGENVRVHLRGNHKNLGEEVPRRFLSAIAGLNPSAPARGSGRLALAERLVSPSNPLTARVLVNRLWQHHFGEGIVASSDNFGTLGQPPTHPALLDYLAVEFIRGGWSIKQMHRLMVLSQTYQMASRGDSRAEAADPENKLLHRMPMRRLEAEGIRDAILTVSGRLDTKPFGPGVMPHLTPFMDGRGRPTVSGPLDGDGRRSIYINVRRNFLTPLFLAFDYPTPFTTIGRRSVSNVPAQALTLMNNPFVLQQAERWAEQALADPALSPAQRVTCMYETAFARLPSSAELADALAFLKDRDSADRQAVWRDFAHVLFNVKEFIFID